MPLKSKRVWWLNKFYSFYNGMLFNWESIETHTYVYCKSFSGKDITYSPFPQKCLWITSNIMKFLSGCQVIAAFQPRSHINTHNAHCWTASLAKISYLKPHNFFQKFLWITCNIMKHISESQNSCAENSLNYSLQVTCTSVQFNVNR